MKKITFVLACLVISLIQAKILSAQSISLYSTSNQPVSGAICPNIPTIYDVLDVPAGCNPSWSAANGTLNYANDGRTRMSITWDDKPNTTASITVTFSGCTDKNDNGKSASWSALILSVKGQAFSSSNSPVNVDYCNTKTVNIYVPHMWARPNHSPAIMVC